MLFVLNSNIAWAVCESGVDVCLEQQPANANAIAVGDNAGTDVSVANSPVTDVAVTDLPVTDLTTEIDKLADAVTADLKARRLTRPVGNNALTKIRQLRDIAPEHDYSINGERYVARIYLSLARSDLKINRVDRASSHYRAALKVFPSLPGLKTVEQQIGLAASRGNTADAQTGIAEKPAVKPVARVEVSAVASKDLAAKPKAAQRSTGESADVLITPVMVGLPAGTFVMGSESGEDNEKPAHQAKIAAFSMSRYEITREQFYAFNADTGVDAVEPEPDQALLPVSGVTSQEAIAYTRWLSGKTGKNYRLPTESEWEYAVRAGTMSPYHSGDAIFGVANCLTCLDEIPRSATPVGSFEPNSFGLYDMHGNVSEWTSSCLTDNYFSYEERRAEQLCAVRVVRGGSWRSTRDQVRSSVRVGQSASARSMDTGFRVVHDGL